MEPESLESKSSMPTEARRGLAIASLVLGILAFCLSLFLVGAVLGLVGLGLGLTHILSKRGRNAMAWWGLSLSVLSIIAAIGLGFAYFKVFKTMKETMASMQTWEQAPTSWEGVLAPDFTVTNLEGQVIRLSELKGKRVVLDFWATWCGPCVKEIPEFIRLQNETAREQLAIIGISQEDKETLKSFVKKKGVNYSIISAKHLPEPFSGIQSIPTTFFIDRKGVIQSVVVGGREFAELKQLATAQDFEGEVKQQPSRPASGLKEAATMLKPVTAWSTNIAGAAAICAAGDWDGTPKILVSGGSKLHVLALDGVEQSVISLPGSYSTIECGTHHQNGARLLGFSKWGQKVAVVDRNGKELWSYSAGMGVDGAHWGDLNGDGSDELIVGMNGFGGLVALSPGGNRIWKVSLGNVWGQAVIPAGPDREALVFATEAGGSVRVFDGKGHGVRTLRPNNAYCTKIAAAVMDRSGQVQALALGQGSAGKGEQAIAFDSTGQVVWSSPVRSAGGWVNARFAYGDVAGDGNVEWAIMEPSGDLVVVTAKGEKLAAVPNQSAAKDFVIVAGKNGRGLLVVLSAGSVQTYSFQ